MVEVDKTKYQVLFKVDSPKDIRSLSAPDLKTLCSEIREYMVDVISQIGGHFGGGLGTVELTVALHR
ncbi:MAG: 1-deoxy-D-xylulose-5-phosphate synthase, partial [Ignavibacteria bacterium]|nr:1-deoxy-D-xylulose-5-phosphate synthase [Ignavibacteria bacterium]